MRLLTHQLETFSEIEAIAKKAEESPVNIANVLENCFNKIRKVTEMEDINFEQKTHLIFFILITFTAAVLTNWSSKLSTDCV